LASLGVGITTLFKAYEFCAAKQVLRLRVLEAPGSRTIAGALKHRAEIGPAVIPALAFYRKAER